MSYFIKVSIKDQTLSVFQDGNLVKTYQVSTAKNGPGEMTGSECTPRGKHIIRAKIGEGHPEGAVFVGRRPTGEIFSEELKNQHPNRDWILTRILWLSGKELGKNRLGKVDSMRRYIYIHGCPDDEPMGTPLSHGCIRMRNNEVIELFDIIPIYTPVDIVD